MGTGGTWRAVFRKHVLIAFTREDVFSEQQNTNVCDRATRGAPGRLQQLIRIDVDSDGDVFGKWQLVDGFPDEAAQAHDGFATDQNVKAKLSL